ncbi:MAG: DNA mismatch repair protein MutS [Prevotellaceae bacterium]|nr:DNA mismatch repair protein MutS [Prevotellaceae bacterium]MDD7377412.1 DNA mismatch repair protein MutS [Prevotellaceae bacterium]PWL80845.1 MAG: DNA mismatch repair protein MutS [Prevotellaceae bacterium]
MASEILTPMMQQFKRFKSEHPDALILFRCGDFYETYLEDAVTASSVLGITLTHRSSKGDGKGTEMAGFPFHALDAYLPKLIRAGFRVAICDQLEDPKLTKKLVKRGITEVVTPGVAMDDNVLSSKENNFLAAVYFGNGACGLAFLDISTGEFLCAEGTTEYVDKLLANFSPKEVLVERGKRDKFLKIFGKYYVYELDDWAFNERSSREKLQKHFDVRTLKGFGIDYMHNGITAAGAVLQYLEMTQHTHTGHITSIRRIDEERFVKLDKFTVRNLEIVQSMNEGGNTLLDVMDRTDTPMGERLLRRWLLFPLRDVKQIEKRQNVVEYFFRNPDFRDVIDENLKGIGDIERLTSKIASERVTPREMAQLRCALSCIVPIRNQCMEASDENIVGMGKEISLCEELRNRISRELVPNPPSLVSKGGVIAEGYNKELDELREISHSSKDVLARLRDEESAKTGIQSLKIGFNNVFGYYLEVRNMHKERVPENWIRKQTLVNAERYITPELKELEEKILGAEDRILALESRLYAELVAYALQYITPLQLNAAIIADIDCLHSFAVSAQEHRYVRPIVDESEVLDIKQGRHPVIETQMPPGESYVSNDVYLDTDKQQIIILTGPNMAGKSALLRQTALIALMAQVGCFVPADSARVGVVDKIFTRVGASDNISAGESTFMLEMSEAASIMNNMSQRSLVLFDELGRGTSTYDGISIAWALVEYLHEGPKGHPRTLFATHYHELNEMEKHFDRIKNFNITVCESNGRIVFLRKLEPGGTAHSFGIHVAKLAGMPPSIIKRSEVILKELEASTPGENVSKQTEAIASSREGTQLSFFQLDDPVLMQIRDEILGLDINNLTPMEALNKLNSIKHILTGK